MNPTPASTPIHTLGHSNHPLTEFLHLLEGAQIERMIDVRSRPASRRHPWFNRSTLERALREIEIGYRWEGRDLGGLRKPHTTDYDRHPALMAPGFQAFARHMEGAAFQQAVKRLLNHAAQARIAVVCAEKDPERCHRSLIADYLIQIQGVKVVHILGTGERRGHEPNPQARPDGESLIYDG